MMTFLKKIADIVITFVLWFYFTIAIIVLLVFYPLLFGLSFLFKNRGLFFQNLAYAYLKSFFLLVRLITPGLKMRLQHCREIANIRSSVIIANHISYLDGLLIFSLNKYVRAILRGYFFKIPVFGWFLKQAGHIPSFTGDETQVLSGEKITKIEQFLKLGGNILIFPEGKRSKNGVLKPFKKGAFSLAYKYQAAIELVLIKNTNVLFSGYLFNTCVKNTIELKRLHNITPDYSNNSITVKELKDQAYQTYLDQSLHEF